MATKYPAGDTITSAHSKSDAAESGARPQELWTLDFGGVIPR